MTCAYIINQGPPVHVAEVAPLGALDALPPLPLLDPLPAWSDVPEVIAPDVAPAAPAAAAPLAEPVEPVPPVEGPAGGMVAGVMGAMGSLAASSQTAAMAAVGELAGYAGAFTSVQATPIPSNAVPTPAIGNAPGEPDLTDHFDSAPEAPGEASAPALELPEPPAYDVADVTIFDIELPDPFNALVPPEPALLAVTAPGEPDFTLPAAPTLLELSVPEAPVLDLPVFDATFGESRPSAPTVAFAYHEIEYESALLTAMTTRLTGMVTDDVTGLPPGTELAIWTRAGEREALLTERATGEALRVLRSRGFRMPQATLTRVVQQALHGGLTRSASLQREVCIEQARLKQQNRRFAIETAISLEGRLMDKHNAAQARALEAAKVMLMVQIHLFDAQVRLFSADVQAFAIKAQVFRVRLDAVLAQLEVYRARLEAEKVKGEINTQMVAIYKAQIEGVRAIVDTFKARVEAAKEMIEGNKALVEAFRARVQAFEATIEAKEAEYQGYAARMKAQASKARLFAEQVGAYKSRVVAYDALVNAKVGAQSLRFKQANEFPLVLYRAKIDAFRSATGAAVQRLKTFTSVFGTRVKAFAATESVKNEHVQARIKIASANVAGAVAAADLVVDAARANLSLAEGAAQTVEQNMRVAGQLAGQLGAAAISAQSVHAAVSESSSIGVSNSTSESASNATNRSSSTTSGESASNNTSISASNGTSRNTSVNNSHGRSYNRGYSNTTSTSKGVSNNTQTSVVNTTALEGRRTWNTTVAQECLDRTVIAE